MKVTLLNHSFLPWLDIGIASLTASLRREGHLVSMVDLAFLQKSIGHEGVIAEVKKTKPDVIYVAVGSNVDGAIALVGKMGEELGVPVLIGGIFSEAFNEASMDKKLYGTALHWQCTMGAAVKPKIEEEDAALLRSLRRIKQGGASGLTVIEGEHLDLDGLPIPDFTLFDVPRYFKAAQLLGGTLPIYASKGCPYTCSFCNIRNRRYQHKKPQRVLEEIKAQEVRHRKDGLKSISFNDPIFGIIPRNFREMMKLFQEDNLAYRLTWHCETRPEIVSREWAEEAAKAGCQIVQFGLESGVERVRNNILNKCYSNARLKQAMRNLSDAGIHCELNLIAGIPGATVWDEIRSVLFAASVRPVGINISHYHPYRETPLGDAYFRDGGHSSEGYPSRERRLLTTVLKASTLPYFMFTGLHSHGLAYLRGLLGYALNVNLQRVLPLSHPLTTALLSNTLIHNLWRERYFKEKCREGGMGR